MTHQAEGSQRTPGMVYSFDATMVPEGWPDSYVSAADYEALREEYEFVLRDRRKARAERDALREQLEREQEAHAQLQARCFDGGSQSVFDAVRCAREQLAAMKASVQPFIDLLNTREERYRKRGGDLNIFPDTHPAFDVAADDFNLGAWRALRDAAIAAAKP